ncbi:MAG: hypothetical protein ACJATP_003859 [Candidatus Azotimanducaceae bacterium]|jgi:hypothetical protein
MALNTIRQLRPERLQFGLKVSPLIEAVAIQWLAHLL